MISLAALLAGFLLDLLLGDPQGFPHPVRLIGWQIAKLELFFRSRFPKSPKGEKLAGLLLVLVMVLAVPGAVWGILFLAGRIHPVLRFGVETLLCYQALAMKSLRDESMKVYEHLTRNDLCGARRAVSMIVGRDTQELTGEGVTKAAVETVAENTSDGEIAPLLYLALGGAPLGYWYKAVNTMDSMLGYRNEKYRYFGYAAAKLDDIANWIPARLAAGFMIFSAWLSGLDGKGAWTIYRRDRRNHASPNSAQTEAVCAGALQVQLAGDAYYFGELHKKPYIGDAKRFIEPEDIRRANRLLYTTSFLFLVAAAGIKYAVIILIS